MDDTLLGADGEFPEINVRALRACAERGIHLALNSGRSFEMLREFACALEAAPFIISVNGARVDAGPDGPTLLERVYDDGHTRAVYEAMRASGLYYTVYTRGHTYMGNSAQRFLYSRFGHHYAHVSHSGPYVYEMVDDEARLRAEGLVHPYKFVALGTEHDARFAGILDAIAPLNMSISSSRADNLEVMMPGVDKGTALAFLAERLGIPREQVMAFGDNTNDLPMLAYAGASVAMENGEESVRRAARFVAPHHARAAWANSSLRRCFHDAHRPRRAGDPAEHGQHRPHLRRHRRHAPPHKALGFEISDRYLKRAGLDYWYLMTYEVHESWQAFLEKYPGATLHFATTKAPRDYCQVQYGADDFLVFGRETRGLPETLLKANYERCVRIPMRADARSLNLSNSVAVLLYEALRQQGFPGLAGEGALTGRDEDGAWRDYV